MNKIEYKEIEKELRLRPKLPYIWGRKQSDDWDDKTNFIYNISSFYDLLRIVDKLPEALKQYALTRWYNFWSAVGVESIFTEHDNVVPHHNKKKTNLLTSI